MWGGEQPCRNRHMSRACPCASRVWLEVASNALFSLSFFCTTWSPRITYLLHNTPIGYAQKAAARAACIHHKVWLRWSCGLNIPAYSFLVFELLPLCFPKLHLSKLSHL